MLFALYSVLCPPGGVHINLEFLFSLTDVKIIKLRNWASFCFGKLMDGITRYKEEKLAYVGGCLLYLQVALRGSVMEGYKAVNQVSATYQSVDTKQKEYGNGIKIGQWSHELHADVADINQVTADIVCQIKDMRGNSVEIGQIIAMNYEPIEMDSSSNKIVEWII